jgi:choline dehydrogenase-like flavoprotein
MTSAIVVGSGPSGVHLAQTLLERGRAVTMLDVGHERPAAPLPAADFDSLKTDLADPVGYFLGAEGQGIAFPQRDARYFIHPPSKEYVFAARRGFVAQTTNFEPAISFAAGGLAEAWTAGVYALNDAELAEFPFDSTALATHYATVARRIGITAQRDDLARFSAWIDDYLEPIEPDMHTARLLERYDANRNFLNRELGFHLGRSRVAVLSRDLGERQACDRLGRCLWGCPRQSLYTPSSTLRQLQSHPLFQYVRGVYVTHFTYEADTVSGIAAVDSDGASRQFNASLYALAAGTLCSSKIVLDSIYHRTGEIRELPGLMDNSQLLVPFVSLGMLGRPVHTHSYQFHQIALGIEQQRPEEYVHGQVTTLKAASVHPVAQSLPLDLRSALTVFRAAHAGLGAANVWLHDKRSAANVLSIRPRPQHPETDLVVRCGPSDPERFERPLKTLRRALRKLGCFVPRSMTRVLPRGASVHYAGTLPMRRDAHAFACTPECRSYDFRNLYFADGASFPFLPAKNLTFTLMANAVRVAEAMDRALGERR